MVRMMVIIIPVISKHVIFIMHDSFKSIPNTIQIIKLLDENVINSFLPGLQQKIFLTIPKVDYSKVKK